VGRQGLDRATPKIITGKLSPARYVPSAATFIGTQDHIGHRCIAGSGFDIQSDLLLGDPSHPAELFMSDL
jgi:hypothetical protein